MIFNEHYNLKNKHSFLSPSKHYWISYSTDRLVKSYRNFQNISRGTRLHELASELIQLGIRLPKSTAALNMFVNDAIGYRMESEQVLYFSENAFGTADAISFRDSKLRIHDLKTGAGKVFIEQLLIYSAIFCLEYSMDPETITIELRIYKGREIISHIPEPSEVQYVMDKILEFDDIIDELKEEL